MSTSVTDRLERMRNLPAAKRALLLRSLQARQGTPETAAIPRRAGDGPAPLSFAQQRLWFLHQLDPASAAYNIAFAVRLEGPLDPAALRRSLGEIRRRHEVLRTRFTVEDGTPAQVVDPEPELALPVVDLAGLAAGEREAEARRLAEGEDRRPFHLENGPLLRATLVRLGPAEHAALLTVHHIVSDAWSNAILTREVMALYEAFSAGRPSPLPGLPLQYADFAAWQREHLQGERLDHLTGYWKERLGGAPAVLELPADRPRPAVRGDAGAERFASIPQETAAALRALGHGLGATPFMVLLAAFNALLRRYTGRADVVVGSPVAGRNRAELEPLIGFFVNTLVLRTDLSGDPAFSELVGRVREVTTAAYDHQDLPFETLVDAVQPHRDLGTTPVFQVVFALQNAPAETLERPGLRLRPLPVRRRRARFDLAVELADAGDALAATWQYSTDLFDGATVDRMLGHFLTLLQGAADDPGRRLSELPLLSPSEVEELVRPGAAPEGGYPQGLLHERFESRAARAPQALAVLFEDERLSYSELDARANRLAHHLRGLGVGPEVRVGLFLERSADLVVAVLGVLKAGGAYVPLDPAYPAERVAWVLADCGAPVVVTRSELTSSLPEHGARLVCLDADAEVIALQPEHAPAVALDPAALAYVIYTSGSTGRPKGVLVTHGHVARLLSATEAWFGFGLDDVWTLFHSYAFDFSVWELWGALAYGGRLVVVPYLVSRSPEAFHELLSRERVTVLNQTPSAFRELARVDGESPRELALRRVVFGGEALEPTSLRSWFERHGDERPRLVNMYGITETTVHVTYRELSRGDAESPDSRIGVPIPDLSVYVLDGFGELAPVGVPGEMYVGGAGVSRGYLGRPELTAERFVPDRFSGREGARLYRTGDLARRLADGDLEYLGRIDQQVKVRGFRIELGEIESVLGQHPGVREAVVTAREDGAGGKRLVAYVVGEAGGGDLRAFAAAKLPDYMVPAVFVSLESLPRTPSGKLDRAALPEPGLVRAEPGAGYTAPRTAVERELAAVWAEVLRVERVGIDDNFFALGGDSILSVRAVALAGQRGVHVTVAQLFQSQTIAGLARNLADGPPQEMPSAAPFALVPEEDRPRLPEGIEDAYPLSMLQIGMLYHAELSPGSALYHNITSFHLRARFDLEVLRQAVQLLAGRHPVLRTSFDLTGYSEPLQLVHRDVEIPLGVVDLRALSAAEQEAALAAWEEADKADRFDTSRAPLLRLQIHLRGEESFQLSLTEHHAILDGWSVSSLLTELFQHYFAILGSSAPVGPPPAAAFRDFVALERAALASEEARGFWERRLSGASVLTLPRLGETGETGVRLLPVEIPESVSDGLEAFARAAGVPLKSVLLAAHLRVMTLLAGQPDVTTGLVAHGRPEGIDGETVLGLFLNTLPFRLRLPAGSWADLARAAFDAESEMLPFRRFPLAQIQAGRNGQALFETAFNFIHFHVYEQLEDFPEARVLGGSAFQETHFALLANFSLALVSRRVQLDMHYAAAELTATQVESIAAWYAAVLAAMAGDGAERHDSRCLLRPSEVEELLRPGVVPEGGYPEGLLHERFAAWAARAPEAPAVLFEDVWLSYSELNARANRLAHHLRGLGVGPEVRVGLFLERSVDLVVAVLGVLKTGGAYVPLDPAYPAERVAWVLADCGAPAVVTRSELAANLPEHGARLVRLDADAEAISRQPEHDPAVALDPAALAYVIYTSGSTGRPKGVLVGHGHVARLLSATEAWFGFGPDDVWTLFHSYAFDFSVWELWGALAYGGRLVVVPYLVSRSPEAFHELLARERVTVLNQTPSAFRELVRADAESPRELALRWVVFGGEALEPTSLRPWFERHGDQRPRLVNMYGITETTVHVTYRELSLADTESPDSRIGAPIPDLSVYVLDGFGDLVPVGVPGEMYVGGAGVSRGYLGRPELTAERFVPDRFGGRPGARLYRTGDLARRLPDGDLEYLGRIDQQVKVRGFRIELGEIESVLGRHPGVRESVVAAREDGAGGKRLVAYVVGKAGGGELRSFAAAELPDYMVPAVFVALESLPRTPSGKLDRGALPEPGFERPDLGAGYAAPRTAVERELAAIWAEVLRVERVGLDDNFFALGGDSMLSLRIVSRARQAGLDFPLQKLYEHQTIRELAPGLEPPETAPPDPDITVDEELLRMLATIEGLSDEDAGLELQRKLDDLGVS